MINFLLIVTFVISGLRSFFGMNGASTIMQEIASILIFQVCILCLVGLKIGGKK